MYVLIINILQLKPVFITMQTNEFALNNMVDIMQIQYL